MQLRPYQNDLKYKIRDALKENNKVCAVSPTGSGKTVIFSDIARSVTKNNKKVWILTHREEIRRQTVNKLVEFGLMPGQIVSGRSMTKNKLQVASVQTLVNKLGMFKQLGFRPDLLIVDECHHSNSDTWHKIIDFWDNMKVIGFTATPQRTDGRGMSDVYDCMVQGLQTYELVEMGALCEPIMLSSQSAKETPNYKIKNGDFDTKQQTQVMAERRIVNDTVETYGKYFKGAPVVIFCPSVEDCERVTESMNNAGWKCGTVKSGMDSVLRERYINGLADGSMNAVCSYDVISEGVDVPILSGVIMRRKTQSLTIYLQQIGRALRPAAGKDKALCIDQVGNIFIHGHPMEHREWNFHSEKRKGRIKDADEPNITECPNCYVVLYGKPDVCSTCGHVFNSGMKRDKKDIKIVSGQFEIIKPPYIGKEAKEISNIMNYYGFERQKAIIDSATNLLAQGESIETVKDRLRVIAGAFNKNESWTEYVWKNYIAE